MSDKGLLIGADGAARCSWCGNDPLYMRYHDEEWGRLDTSDRGMFEKITLEGFQAGLSWITILRRRETLRAAFDHFDFYKVSEYGAADVARLLQDSGIIRHELKIKSAINNARQSIKIIDEFGSLCAFFEEYKPQSARVISHPSDVPAQTSESVALSKDLKKRGFSFVGPVTMYALMQATGLVNDHMAGCHVRTACD